MKVHITVTNEAGEVFQGELQLAPAAGGIRRTARQRVAASPPRAASTTPDLDLPLRPFLKQYARGRSGAAKLTVLIAHIAQGKTDVAVDSADLQSAWNRATAFLGEFNRAHATRAKDNGWIDSLKHGEYVLRESWKEAVE